MIGRILGTIAVLFLIGAAPASKVIPLPNGGGEALIIPAASPVKFLRWEKSGGEYVGARFSGRFVLTGQFTWGCEWDCNDGSPITEADNFALRVVPDSDLAARLPHWKVHNQDIAIFVARSTRFTHSITTAQQRADLASGKLPDVHGRISIVVDHFETSLDCDSANFGADFVAIATPRKFAKVDVNGNYGCG